MYKKMQFTIIQTKAIFRFYGALKQSESMGPISPYVQSSPGMTLVPPGWKKLSVGHLKLLRRTKWKCRRIEREIEREKIKYTTLC